MSAPATVAPAILTAAEMQQHAERRRLRALIHSAAGQPLRVELPAVPLPARPQDITAIARETLTLHGG